MTDDTTIDNRLLFEKITAEKISNTAPSQKTFAGMPRKWAIALAIFLAVLMIAAAVAVAIYMQSTKPVVPEKEIMQ